MASIDTVLLKERLGEFSGRFDVDALDECDSTSSELMRRADRGAPSGSVVVADRQSAGRGRRGRHWLSTPEASLTFSLLWRFPGKAAGLAGLSLAVGVGLVRVLERLGARGVRLKWPNDVLLAAGDGYAKLAGILIELASDRRGTQAIIGIGLNLAPPAGELEQPAAGLSEACAVQPERHAVLAGILVALAEVMQTFAVDGFKGLKSEWQSRHAWQDLAVQIVGDGEASMSGRCLGVDDDGCLRLETATGIERILSGDLSLRPAGEGAFGSSPLGGRPGGSALGVRPVGEGALGSSSPGQSLE